VPASRSQHPSSLPAAVKPHDFHEATFLREDLFPGRTRDDPPVELDNNHVGVESEIDYQIVQVDRAGNGLRFTVDFELHCCLHAMYHNE
jgi:hypothetical protein